jgi:DNA adenine methylase
MIIRYFGGKGGMFKEIIKYFPQHDTYIEAFGGGASLLLRKEPSPIEIYNDLEENVYSLFKVISSEELFKEFKNKLDLTPYSRQLSEEYEESLKNDNLTIIDRAYKYFYVNRTVYNGVGSFSYSLVVRRNMSKPISDYLSVVDRLPEIHQRLSKVVIEKIDALKLIEKYDKPDVFMYLDPPYLPNTRTGGKYKEDMSEEQHINFINLLKNIQNAKILLSGYNNELYNTLNWKRVDFEVKTQTNSRKPKTKTESLWLNY